MRTRAGSKMRLSNTKLKFESDDEDFETPVFKNIDKPTEYRQSEDSTDESDDNLSVKSDEESSENDEDATHDLVSEDDSDDVPDDISFSQSRETALTQIKMAMKQINDDKSKKRMKRKQIDDLFKEQKRKKLEKFATEKLPDDILDSIPSGFEQKPSRGKKQTVFNKSDKDTDSDHLEDEMLQENEDFIPLSSKRWGLALLEEHSYEMLQFWDQTLLVEFIQSSLLEFRGLLPGIQVVSLRDNKSKHKSLAQSAADFRQNRLYGGKIRREKFQDKLSKMEKRRARYK